MIGQADTHRVIRGGEALLSIYLGGWGGRERKVGRRPQTNPVYTPRSTSTDPHYTSSETHDQAGGYEVSYLLPSRLHVNLRLGVCVGSIPAVVGRYCPSSPPTVAEH